MSISFFFINRPVFAWVIAILVLLGGMLSVKGLPVAQYPDIAPPQIQIIANYPGADAQTVENTVTQIIEKNISGIDGLLYFSSTSKSTGGTTILVTLKHGTDPDVAQEQLQNKVNQATASLPSQVQQNGVTVTKTQSTMFLMAALYDKSNKASNAELNDYFLSNATDTVSRVTGVASMNVFGSTYAMRIWLNPTRLASYSLMPSDVATAVQSQNAQVSAGQVGNAPADNDVQLNATITGQTLLQTPEQFGNIVLKTEPNGANVLLKDVARVELNSQSFGNLTTYNGHPSAGIGIQLTPGANALEVSQAVKQRIDELKRSFPPGWEVDYPMDNTQFINSAIDEVIYTILGAAVLVILVIFLFLQDWRLTLVPAITIPVVLLGVFCVLYAFGLSINTLTLFGLVLAIGLLVDDAIVVVENVRRIMDTEGLGPIEATRKSMAEISGALIGIAAVLSAVFVPMAFFGGSIGVIYRQFTVTLVSAMVLSILAALILAPAICASLLKPRRQKEDGTSTWKPIAWFNQRYNALEDRYNRGVSWVTGHIGTCLVAFAVVLIAIGVMFKFVQTSFFPTEDQGYITVQYTLPSGRVQSATNEVGEQIDDYFTSHYKDSVAGAFNITGYNFSGAGLNSGMAYVQLKDWGDRSQTAMEISKQASADLASIKGADVQVLAPPPIQGLGQSADFTMQLEAQGTMSRDELHNELSSILKEASKDPRLAQVRVNELPAAPKISFHIDPAKAQAYGVDMSTASNVISAGFGSSYINNFINAGRVKDVYMQGDKEFRRSPEDINQWYVKSSNGSMVPLGAVSEHKWDYAPMVLNRFNGFFSYQINGSPAAGVSSGEAMNALEQIVDRHPGISFSWSDMAYEEHASNQNMGLLYFYSVVFIFLCLAALYESWSVPFTILLVLPLGVVGALAAVMLRGLSSDIYFQIALLTAMGLSAKNAILIVEFAEARFAETRDAVASAIFAAKRRLRPILMTSIAFMAGILPLALASGPGSNSRISIGTGILGGTLTGTLFSVFLVPVYYIVVKRVFGWFKARRQQR